MSFHLTQLAAPRAVRTAARMLITVWMANFQNSLFFIIVIIFILFNATAAAVHYGGSKFFTFHYSLFP